MEATLWQGPNGTQVRISRGSSKPPKWALLLIDRVAHRAGRSAVGLRWTNGDGGGYYYPNLRVISIKAGGHGFMWQRQVLVHELAHWLDPFPQGRRHGDTFWATSFLIAADEKCLRALTKEAGPTRARRARKLLAVDPSTHRSSTWRMLAVARKGR
jgi:hypothetical protein